MKFVTSSTALLTTTPIIGLKYHPTNGIPNLDSLLVMTWQNS